HPELEERTHAAVERRILLDGAVFVHGDHPQKMSLFLIPQVVQRSRFDLFCGLTIPAGELLISKEFSEPGSSIESSIDRRRRVCEDSASLFPQIIGGLGQMCVRLTVAD